MHDTYWQQTVSIGPYTFPRFIGAPLDSITDSPFRQLVRQFSTDELLYTEMRHVGSIAADKEGFRTVRFEQWERPLNYQIAANSADYIDAAIDRILAAGVDMIDLNVGCPARNVIGSGCGSALMADLPRLELILKTLRKKVSIPLTVKIRAGFKECNAVEVALLAQDCGVDALAIHPRLQTQKFEGRPDYTVAARVKKGLQIPVLLSGNVVNWPTARMAYEATGVDGFLIGRGLWGRPWKLKEMREHSHGRAYAITRKEMLSCALDHLRRMIGYYGPKGLFAFRKHISFYIAGMQGAGDIRAQLVLLECAERVEACLQGLYASIE
jgi:tRNA-dihydrouridine synthase B